MREKLATSAKKYLPLSSYRQKIYLPVSNLHRSELYLAVDGHSLLENHLVNSTVGGGVVI